MPVTIIESDPRRLMGTTTREQPLPKASDLSHDFVRTELRWAQESQASSANDKRFDNQSYDVADLYISTPWIDPLYDQRRRIGRQARRPLPSGKRSSKWIRVWAGPSGTTEQSHVQPLPPRKAQTWRRQKVRRYVQQPLVLPSPTPNPLWPRKMYPQHVRHNTRAWGELNLGLKNQRMDGGIGGQETSAIQRATSALKPVGKLVGVNAIN